MRIGGVARPAKGPAPKGRRHLASLPYIAQGQRSGGAGQGETGGLDPGLDHVRSLQQFS